MTDIQLILAAEEACHVLRNIDRTIENVISKIGWYMSLFASLLGLGINIGIATCISENKKG